MKYFVIKDFWSNNNNNKNNNNNIKNNNVLKCGIYILYKIKI